ncbi:tetratricopeptide repeat protein [Leptolyngbyaceae cyanobacterium CCMR0081]|uniref:Tetratricopeptide repeat protein n=1 Tax=Adonisia turfae CCMR0081 TaxID=2292702 RepID=A0A6M0RQZ9_9CYAN|nr:tetratricopeptide repeat protein [Adonisia turfae CCMR0081]
MTLSRMIQDRQGEGQSLGSLGMIYFALEDYDRAIDYQYQALEISQMTKTRSEEAIILCNLGNVLIQTESYEKSLDCLQKSLGICADIDDPYTEAQALKGLAEIYKNLGNDKLANHYCTEAISIASNLKIPFLEDCLELKKSII